MPEYPPVTLAIFTYRRPLELERTIASLQENIIYPADKLTYLICDDSSGNGYPNQIRQNPRFRDLHIEIVSTSFNAGIGASMNNGLANVRTEFVYCTQDDFEMVQPLDLRKSIALMMCQPNVGIIRYAALGSDQLYIYRQHEVDVSEWLPEHISGPTSLAGKCVYLIIDRESPSLYVYSDNAHLRRMSWMDTYGMHPTHLKLGASEDWYCHRVKDVMRENGDALWIVCFPENINSTFKHVSAHSWQHSPVDVERAST